MNKTAFCKGKKVLYKPYFSWRLKRANHSKIQPYICSSLEELCELYPLRVCKLFAHLDLTQPGLKAVSKSVERQDWVGACESLIEYYQQSDRFKWIDRLKVDCDEIAPGNSEQILRDTYSFQSSTATVPRFENGLLDWTYKGYRGDREWGWYLNRHYHLLALLQAYRQTNNPLYVEYINSQILDWVISNPSRLNPTIEMSWRGLEVAFRVFHWTQIFYSLQEVERFTPAARILMLSSILDHAYYLKYFCSWGVNWLVKEMNALAMIAVCWSEFKSADSWLKFARNNILRELKQQIYPDGVQKELSSHYHSVALQDFQSFANLMAVSDGSVPSELKRTLEQMWNYLAYTLRPNGYGILNNDSDLNDNRDLIEQAAKIYQRDDWKYIVSHGKTGSQPQENPSTAFVWSKQSIIRNNWSKNAHWLFFDAGPSGVYYHSHNDKLHLSINAYGRDLLVDSGRYSYVRDEFWHYFRGSASHNVILIDGNGQKDDFSESFQPMTRGYGITPQCDYASGIFDRGFINVKDRVSHFRMVIYVRNKYWVVIDRLTCNRPHQIQPLWHFHPDCKVAIEAESVATVDRDLGNLRIIPASNLQWSLDLVRGQKDPVQGWWSPKYNVKVPSPTAVYSARIAKPTTFAWVLYPAKDIPPHPNVSLMSVSDDSATIAIEKETIVADWTKDSYIKLENRCPI